MTVRPHDRRRWQLLVAIQQSGVPLSANELFTRVPEYRAGGGERSDALEKQLERDRQALADDGFIVEVVADPSAPSDRARWRYALSDAPAHTVSLSPDQAVLAAVATEAWIDDGLARDARRSYLKLLGLSAEVSAENSTLPTLRLVTHPAFTALRDAAARHAVVMFDYANQSEQAPKRRRVVPLQLEQHQGRWLCNAWDLDRDAERNFVLTRIVSPVEITSEIRSEHRATTDLAATLDALAATQPAVLRVAAQSDAALRLRDRTVQSDHVDDHLIEITVHDWDHGLLADELASLGQQVSVRAPDELRASVRRRLERVRDLHESQQGAPS